MAAGAADGPPRVAPRLTELQDSWPLATHVGCGLAASLALTVGGSGVRDVAPDRRAYAPSRSEKLSCRVGASSTNRAPMARSI